MPFVKKSRLNRYRLGPTLREVVERELATPEDERYDVAEELALIAEAANPAITLYERLRDDTKMPEDKKLEALMAAGQIMSGYLQEVIKTRDMAARIAVNRKDSISALALQEILADITQHIRRILGPAHTHLYEQINVLLMGAVRLPDRHLSEGTKKLPEHDVADMDETVPREPVNV
jgi:hypothetical protein